MVINNPALTTAFPDETAMITDTFQNTRIPVWIYGWSDLDSISTFFQYIPNWFVHQTDSANSDIWKIFWLGMVKKQKVIQAQFS